MALRHLWSDASFQRYFRPEPFGDSPTRATQGVEVFSWWWWRRRLLLLLLLLLLLRLLGCFDLDFDLIQKNKATMSLLVAVRCVALSKGRPKMRNKAVVGIEF